MNSTSLLDAAGRLRSPATMLGWRLVLPARTSHILIRALLYTAMTWARELAISIIDAVAAVAHPRLGAGEYVALQAGVGWRLSVELIDGEAVVTPPTGGQAASIQGELFYALRRWQESTANGGLLLQDVFVRLPDDQYLAPDIAWWTARRRPALSSGAVDVVPDLVVEVLSAATRANDLGAKRELYLGAGVQELWLIDPDAATVVRVLRDGPDERLARGDQLESAVFPGLALSISRLLAS